MSANGTQIAECVHLIKNGAASCASIQISNDAIAGDSVTWANTLAANAWLRLTSATQKAEVSVDSGSNWTPSNSGMTGTIPRVKGGVTNNITVVGQTTGTYRSTYTARG